MPWARRLQCAAACVAVAAYAGLSHYCNSSADARELGAALAVSPLTAISVVLAWRGTQPLVALFLTVTLLALLYVLWTPLQQNFPVVTLLEESGVYGVLAATFGRSLLPNQTPLCTRLADQVHGPLSAREQRYTRRVTVAWAAFFLAIASLSILLFLLAPLRTWSIYVNFCVLPLVASMFVGEYLVRRYVLPENRRAGLLATVRVYFATPH